MLGDFIRGFSNALSDNVCDELIAWFENTEFKKNTNFKIEVTDRTSRKDVAKWLPEKHLLYKELEFCKMKMLKQYLAEFPYAYREQKNLISKDSKIQRTEPMGGGFHNFHSEISNINDSTRALVWTVYLNDIPDGEGETEFLYEKIRVQPKKGMGCIFPAAWMYQHRGNPVHAHSKYIATGWYHYPTLEQQRLQAPVQLNRKEGIN